MGTSNEHTTTESERERAYEKSRVYRWIDDRVDLDNETILGKAFPEDRFASFLLGETALFSFVILVITGTFLGLFYTPGSQKAKYTGAAAQYAGKQLPQSFASVLRITYDIRLGFFTRMVHHWAAYVFIAAIAVHMLRVFFSGAYRKPRDVNWVIGATLMVLALAEAYFGYALPFDSYGSTATGIGFEMVGSVPVIGTALKELFFGGHWPSNANAVLPRMFLFHVFLIPALIAVFLAAHMYFLIRQKHTEQRGAREEEPTDVGTDDTSIVTGIPLFPNQTAVMFIVFFTLMGVISLLAGFFPVQRIAHWGPNNPASTPSGVAPDWYFMWVFGTLKMTSGIPYSRFIGGVLLPVVILVVLFAWPYIDRGLNHPDFLADPIARPFQTSIGIGAVTLIMMLSIDGMNNVVSHIFGMDIGQTNTLLRVLSVVVPIVWTLVVYGVLKRGDTYREAQNIETTD